MLKKSPSVSVIVVNYNKKHDLKECLNSLRKTIYPDFEVILVDNGSTDGSIDLVKENFKWVRLIENKENVGPIVGRNIGIKMAKNEFIAFLDNDTVVDSDWLSELIRVMRRDKNIGACACKVKLYSNKKLINSAGMGCDIYGFAFSRGLICRNNFEEDKGQYDEIEEVFSAYAAAMLTRKDVLEKINYLNPDFGMYYEEIDLSWRIRLVGYKIVYVPSSVVFHKMSKLKTVFTSKVKYFTEKNRLRTIIQNYSLLMLLRVLPIYSFLKLSEFLLYIIFNKPDDAIGLSGGIFSVIKDLPKVLSDRARVQKIRKVKDEDIVKHMESGSRELSMFLKGYGKFVLR